MRGGHEHNNADIEAPVSFADWHLFGIRPRVDFKRMIIDKQSPEAFFSW